MDEGGSSIRNDSKKMQQWQKGGTERGSRKKMVKGEVKTYLIEYRAEWLPPNKKRRT